MAEKKTVRMGGGETENEPTVLAGDTARSEGAPPPFVRTQMPTADQPTPRPAQAGWGQPPAAPPPAPGWAPQPAPGWAPRPEAATMLISQRPSPVFAWLAVMDGPEKGRIHQLRPDTTTIGRVAGNDVVVADDTVSSQHVKIRIEPQENSDDQYVLIDLASRNGTFVGSKATYRDPASRVYRHLLQDGDYLLLGETTLVFKRV